MKTHPMSCNEALEKLPLYVGRDLDSDALEGVRAHLEFCGPCSLRAEEALRARRALVAAFRARETELARPELWPGIRAVLRSEGLIHGADAPATARPVKKIRRPRWTQALLPVAAAAALFALAQLGGLFSTRDSGKELRPNDLAPQGEPVVVTPVSTGGTLRNVAPDEADILANPFRPRVRWVKGVDPAGGQGIVPAEYIPPGYK